VARAYKTVADTFIEPISFIVPRRAEVFQTDIYPPTYGLKPGVTSGEWFGGKTAIPPLVSLQGRYDGGSTSELPASQQPAKTQPKAAPVTNPPPTKTTPEPPKPKPAPEPVAMGPKGELKDNKKAMADMASKFADKDESDDDDDASSFEEVRKPVERPTRAAEPAKPAVSSPPASARAPPKQEPAAPAPAASQAPEPAAAARAPASGLVDGLKNHLSDIKSTQSNTLGEIAELKDQVKTLTELVKQLSSKLDGLEGGQSERIRRLELEMEGMRD